MAFLIEYSMTSNLVFHYESTFVKTLFGREDLQCLSFWRGRVALWTILKAAGIGEGDEVILPAYTCGMVPTAVRYTGATCVFCDLPAQGYNITAEQACAAVTSRTKAVICQHTYGIPFDINKFRSLCDKTGLLLIEDCCQAIAVSDPLGTVGDAAIFSMQWNKPYTTGLGGMAVFQNTNLYKNAYAIREQYCRKESIRRSLSLLAQLCLYFVFARGKARNVVAELYRIAQQLHLIKGTTSPEELQEMIPADYLADAVPLQAFIGLHQLKRWSKNYAHRLMITDYYRDMLDMRWLTQTNKEALEHYPVWAVPLLVNNKQEFLQWSYRQHLPVQTWFSVLPIHLAPETCMRFQYYPGQCPRAEQVCLHEIHLPTSPIYSLKQARRLTSLLPKVIEQHYSDERSL